MKHNRLLIAACIIIPLLFSCKSKQEKGKAADKIKDGIGNMYWDDGSVKGTGQFKMFKKEGKWTLFHRGEKLKLAEGNYKEDKQDGKWLFYHKNGAKSAEGMFIEDQKTGEWLRFYETGENFGKENYVITEIDIAGFKQKIGGIEGTKKTFFKSGKLKMEEEYRKGLKNGITREYYEDGKPKEFSEYKNNNYNGKVNKFWPNGRSQEQSYFVDGKRNGLFRLFHMTGARNIEGQFQNGLQTGMWRYYSADNRLMKEGLYKIEKFGQGAKEKLSSSESGLWTFYSYDTGRQVKAMEVTVKGIIITDKGKLYSNGQLTGEGGLSGMAKAIFDMYKDGAKSGLVEAADVPADDPAQKLTHKWTGTWVVPKKDGDWTEYYPGSRAKKFVAKYMRNKFNGPITEYYQNGKLKATGEYMNGKKNGEWKFFNTDGSVDSENSGRYMMDKKSKI